MSPSGHLELSESNTTTAAAILLVGDNSTLLDVLRTSLGSGEFIIHTAREGESMLALARSVRPDLIIADAVVPDIDGVELCRQLKQDPATSDIPLLLITDVRWDVASVMAGLDSGADDYLDTFVLSELLRKKAERLIEQGRERRARKEAEERYRSLVESLPAIVYIAECEPPYSTIYVSPGIEALGYTVEEWCSEPDMWVKVLHPDDRDWVLEETEAARATGRGNEYEYRVVVRDGSVRWLHDKGRFVSGQNGTYWQGVTVDITKQKTAEEALRLTQFSIDHCADGAFWIGADAKFLYVNNAACRSLAYTREELLSMTLHDVDLIFTETAWPKYWELTRQRRPFTFESLHRARDGRVFPVEVTASYLKFNGSEYSCAFARDISERKLMERALKTSNDRYHSFIQQSSEGIFRAESEIPVRTDLPEEDQIDLFYTHMCLAECNEVMARMYGFAGRDELLGKRLDDLLVRSDPNNREFLRLFIRSGYHLSDAESYQRDQAGNVRIFRISLIGIVESGRLVRVWGTQRDITERKRTEEALRQSEERFRLMFANNPIPSWVYDRDTLQFLEVNKAAVEHYGYSRDEFLAMRITDLRLPEDLPAVVDQSPKERSNVSIPGQWRHRRKDGQVIDVQITSHTLEFAGHKGVLVVADDITERKKAEEQLRSANQLLETVMECATNAIAAVDLEGRFMLVNRRTVELTGYASEELIGYPFSFLLPPAALSPVREQLSATIVHGRSVTQFETELVRKDGTTRVITFSLEPMTRDGKTYGVVGTAEDITERKLLQEQLIQSEKLAALGQLVSGVTHELNNPLTSVLGFTQLMLTRSELSQHDRERLEIINNDADRARRIVQKLLAFSRQNRPCRVKVDLNELLEQTLDLRAYEMKVNNIAVRRELGRITTVIADEGQIQQVFLNIIVNAEQAIQNGKKKGTITVRTRVREEAGAGWAVVEIVDDGPGVAPENLRRVFDPFFTTRELGKGTGLGLSISYGIIKEHGGRILIDSKSGSETTFCIELPLKPYGLSVREH